MNPTLLWNALPSNSVNYEIEVATDTAFTNIVFDTQTTLTTVNVTGLEVDMLYYWRVKSINACNSENISEVFAFDTNKDICEILSSNHTPKEIISNGTSVVTSSIHFSGSGEISDVSIKELSLLHNYLPDLTITLKSPQGTTVEFYKGSCISSDSLLLNFNDESVNAYSTIPCPAVSSEMFKPLNSFSVFNGENPTGVWTLSVQDNSFFDGGFLNSWKLNVCYDGESANSVQDLEGNNIQVFPNPTNGNITIKRDLLDESYDITIFDVSGKLLLSDTFSQLSEELNTQELPAGIYFVNLMGRERTIQTIKLVKH